MKILKKLPRVLPKSKKKPPTKAEIDAMIKELKPIIESELEYVKQHRKTDIPTQLY